VPHTHSHVYQLHKQSINLGDVNALTEDELLPYKIMVSKASGFNFMSSPPQTFHTCEWNLRNDNSTFTSPLSCD